MRSHRAGVGGGGGVLGPVQGNSSSARETRAQTMMKMLQVAKEPGEVSPVLQSSEPGRPGRSGSIGAPQGLRAEAAVCAEAAWVQNTAPDQESLA